MVNAIDILERPVIDVPRAVSVASVAERYLAHRSRRLTLTHQQAMDEFARTVGQVYRSTDELMTAYFGRFKQQREQQQAAYEARVAQIRGDRRIDSLRAEQEIQKLRIPLMPSWTEENERGFLFTYGDPRVNVVEWNSRVQQLSVEQMPLQRNGRSGVWVRTPWELMIPKLLATPEMDGSVAPCVLIDATMLLERGSQAEKLFTRGEFAPPVDPDRDPEYYEAMMRAARATCPHCFEIFPRGFQAHEMACARKHNVPSIHEGKNEEQSDE